MKIARSDQSHAVLMELRGMAVGFISSALAGRKPQPLMQHQMFLLLQTKCFCKLLALLGCSFSGQALMSVLGHGCIRDTAGFGEAGCLGTGLSGS